MGKLFGGGKKAPEPQPLPVPPPPTPIVDESAVARAKKKELAAQRARGGRQSTILSSNDDSLGV